jgi:hypothetical protein
MRRLCLAATIAVCFLFSAPAATFAQTSNATLGGTVGDTSGALIPGVSITATNTQTGIVSSVISNEAGAYQFASLQTGTYTISAELPGFQTQVYNQVTLGIGQQVRLNFTLAVSAVAQAVEVTVRADTLLATSSSSVGTVLPEYKVRDLPLGSRNVLDLVATAGGTQGGNFAGGRVGMVNTTRDGISVQDSRYANGVYSVTYVSPDLVEEVRVVVGPVDASAGRGSGQFQMATRSGTNQFRGSVFWTNRNSAATASSWFNNFSGTGKNYLNRNQFGGRIGGPIFRNKTFFFFLFEGMRTVEKAVITGPVLTEPARQGIFRYFPGVQSSNATSNNPTVDLMGNPVAPRGATGDLQSVSLFGRDPLRPGFDPTGVIQRAIASMPAANDFTTGDGLNTAGHRWVRRTIGTENNNGTGESINRNQYNLRLDHHFNSNHKLSLVGTIESTWADSNLANVPNGQAPGAAYNGAANRLPRVHNASFISTLSPTVLNEFRIGMSKQVLEQPAAWDDARTGAEVMAALPRMNGIPYLVQTSLFNAHNVATTGASRGNVSPYWIYVDTLSWTRAKHAFKGGVEFRKAGTSGYDSNQAVPRVNLGPSPVARDYGIPNSGVPVTGIDNTTVPGLAAADQANARVLLTDLAGSIQEIVQRFTVCCDPSDIRFKDYSEQWRKYRDLRQTEFSAFFKDDWKIRPDLTLNLGMQYEWYGSVYDNMGYGVAPVGGGEALAKGSLIVPEFVGKKSAQPDKQFWRNDWNNIAPAVGLSWSVPYWGKDKTVVRAGYGWRYMGRIASGGGLRLALDIGQFPGAHQYVVDSSSTNYRDLRDVFVPLPGRYPAGQLPVVPYTARNEPIATFDPNSRTPYIQNWNVEIQRELVGNLTLEARYVGSKGTKLYGGIPVNDVNIFENGILEAFNLTRGGGNAPLFDRMLRGLNFGLGAVNGTTITGSASLRQNTTTRSMIANGNVGALAAFLNTNETGGERGNLLRNAGLPENFIVTSPQFSEATYHTDPGNSTYHSMQLQVTKRLSQGFTNQTTYTWSRAIGESDGDGAIGYLNPRNRSLNKSLLSYHRTHDLRSNGTFELPFGPNRRFLNSAPSWVTRLVEQWQLGGIFTLTSGAPLTITAPVSTFTQQTAGTPNIVGEFPKSAGKVTRVANGVVYFDGLGQIPDPARANVTTLQSAQGAFSNRAITDAEGRLLLVNPEPGTLGNLGLRWIEGPGTIGLDMNLIKRVRITETKEFELRLDAINVLNRPNFGNPNVNINSTSFGRITSATGSRAFTINTRVSF